MRDALCWHYPTYHGLEMPYARIEEIENIDKNLANKIRNGERLRKGVFESTDEYFAYKYHSKTGYVRRRELALWKAFKWASIQMEKHKPHRNGKQLELTVQNEREKETKT